MMIRSIVRFSAVLALIVGFSLASQAGEVTIYTGITQWITKPLADVQAQICKDKLDLAGVSNNWLQFDTDAVTLAEWMQAVTGNGETDVCVLYGDTPPEIYPILNSQPDGSILESYLESEDGDVIINHADYMFWGYLNRNGEGGLQSIMDIPGIVMWDDNTIVDITEQGREIAPSLVVYPTDRPFHLDQLAGEWFAEAILMQNAAGTRADPAIIRDGPRGRLCNIYQSADQNDPKGAVAAEVIFHLFGMTMAPAKLNIASYGTTLTGRPTKATITFQDITGSPRPAVGALTLNLATDSATGRFDTLSTGPFNGSITSVTVPAGGRSATFYFKDSVAHDAVITVSATGLETGQFTVKVLEEVPYENGEVVIYTGITQWIDKGPADEQAQKCVDKLALGGISAQWLSDAGDAASVADWMSAVTGNGQRDVLVLYGDTPPEIYPILNSQPDGSILETYLESTDGDAIINHADYMFWGYLNRNGEGGLQSIMDIPGIVMWDDNTMVNATEEGIDITPSVPSSALTDRPFHLEQLAGDWFPELICAQNPAGNRADPAVVRDGNRGRLIPVFQSAFQNDPKAAVAAELIFWTFGKKFDTLGGLGLTARGSGPTGKGLLLTLELQDITGSPQPASTPVVVNLVSDKATGKFDLTADGAFNGTLTSVTVPAGQATLKFYYKDTAAGAANITVSSAGLTSASFSINIFALPVVPAGEVVIFTGTTQWITKPLADEQALITVDALANAGITATILDGAFDGFTLATWMKAATGNGQTDVLILYGDVPPTIYPASLLLTDGSDLELFLESEDGDAVINHADYMFYGITKNTTFGLQSVMDNPNIFMWDDNTPMTVTPLGATISPTLADFQSDRPFHLDELNGDWFDEAILAQNATGTRADPVIVRDGPRGRLIPVFQTADQADPKGQVAAEIIIWLFNPSTPPPPPAAPTGLTAVAGNAQVTLDWNDNAEANLSGYNLYRSDAGGAFNKVNGALLASSNYVDSGLTNGVEYCYKVQAVNAGGPSPDSNTSCATTTGGGGTPNFRRGDVDRTGTTELTDVVNLVGFLYLGTPAALFCMDAADADDTGVVELTDAIVILGWLYQGNPLNLPAPGALTCGPDGNPSDTLAPCVYTCAP